MFRDRRGRNLRPFRFEALEPRALLSGVLAQSTVAAEATPPPVSLRIAPSSDPAGDGVVTSPRVVIEGQTAPGASVKLQLKGQSRILATTTADTSGEYQFQVAVKMGTTSFVVRATASGMTSRADLSVIRANQVVAGNSVALQTIRNAKVQAPDVARDLAIVETSVFDAVDAVKPKYAAYQLSLKAPRGASADAAAIGAAYTALVGLFPTQASMLQAQESVALASVPSGSARSAGLALGNRAASEILALRAGDGSATMVNYVPGTAPGQWQPTPPTFAKAVDPQWGQVTPFALKSGSQFQPPPPPALNSPEYAAAYNQVMSLGAVNSTTRTPDETAIARFWSDLPGTFDPPGHWNQIGEIAAETKQSSLIDSARTFALLDMALADAGIECWGVKYTYNFWRPVTAIRAGNDGLNALTVGDPTWTPLWATPAFPSYVSGHSTFSASAAAVLDAAFGSKFAFSDPGDPTMNLTARHYTSFDQAAQEAGMSRIYGGIHYMFDNTAGLQLGGEVGRYVVTNELKPLASSHGK